MSSVAVRCGVDVVDVAAFERLHRMRGQTLLRHVFTERERAECHGDDEMLAARFAAKEATSKALGCGIGPIAWRDLETTGTPPRLVLRGAAAARARDMKLSDFTVSLTHNAGVALAFVVALGATA